MSPPPSSLPISAGLSAQTVGSACQRKKTYPSSLLSACCRPAAQFGGCAVGRHPHGPSSASLHSLPVDQGASELRVDPSSSFGPLPICVTDAIDSGNIQVESLRGDRVELRIKSDPFTVSTDNRSHCQWFHFRASNVKGRPLTFAIRNCKECSFPAAWDGYQTVASYDGEEWFRVTTTTYDDASGTLEWSITPEHSTVSFAYFAPYSYERHQTLISRAMRHPSAEQSVLGSTLEGRPLDMLTVGTGPVNVWLIARQHPGEPMAEWLAEGFLDKVLGSTEAQEAATFRIIPNMNPDGSVRGHLRTNAAGANLNREWAPTGSYDAPTLERSPEVYHVLRAMDATGVDLFLDVHGDEEVPANFWAGFEGVLGASQRNLEIYSRFQSAMLAASPDFQTEKGYPVEEPGQANLAICSNQVAHRFGCVALTFEQPFKDCWNSPDPVYGWSPQRAVRLGASTLDAILEILPSLRE